MISLHISSTRSLGVQKVKQSPQRSVQRQLKPDIHPEYFEESPVYCNGEEVMRVGGTKKEYTVDIWSGNHPFYQGIRTAVVVDEGRVNRFKRRFAGLESMSNIETASQASPASTKDSGPKQARKSKNKGKAKKN
eukprot:TRINITY_DN7138_c0_g2_i4.p6 TRINITY_DN7138_c0_g2~~TRINITY_DN7138_c0_g2_i4.p6  ORF type:complete len:134 (-),score=14.19 TRINITY_DN7138_c0_g2_i4:131-532(-)